MNITHDEIKKLAKLSRLAVTDDEVVRLHGHLTSVLTYAARVQDIAQGSAELDFSSDSRLRADQSKTSHSQPLMEQAPDSQENLFVVPKIL